MTVLDHENIINNCVPFVIETFRKGRDPISKFYLDFTFEI